MPDFSTGTVLVPTSGGHYVTEEQRYIAEIVHDYDRTLDVVHIPPDKRISPNLAWAVVCHPDAQPAYFVFYAETCDQRMLERLWTNDNARTNVIENIDAQDAAARALKLRKSLESTQEAAEFGAYAMRSPLNWYHYTDAKGNKRVIRN